MERRSSEIMAVAEERMERERERGRNRNERGMSLCERLEKVEPRLKYVSKTSRNPLTIPANCYSDMRQQFTRGEWPVENVSDTDRCISFCINQNQALSWPLDEELIPM